MTHSERFFGMGSEYTSVPLEAIDEEDTNMSEEDIEFTDSGDVVEGELYTSLVADIQALIVLSEVQQNTRRGISQSILTSLYELVQWPTQTLDTEDDDSDYEGFEYTEEAEDEEDES